MAGDRDLHEEKVVEPVGIDFDLGAVFQPVDGGIALPKVIHARLQIGAPPCKRSKCGLKMRATPARTASKSREAEDQGLVGK